MTRKELSQLYPKRVIAAQETREDAQGHENGNEGWNIYAENNTRLCGAYGRVRRSRASKLPAS